LEAHPPKRPIVGLLTDFGQQDHYVGVVKAVLAGIVPQALVIDVTHEVPPQDLLAGQRLLRASQPYFPAGTIFLAIVDPGVGSRRRGMALSHGGQIFVGPDNGLFTPWTTGEWLAVELTASHYQLPSVSSTFHGRDIFAPAAAYLATGVPLLELGPELHDPVRLLPPSPLLRSDGTIEGELVYVDHFGNLISNIARVTGGSIRFRDLNLPLRHTYAETGPNELLALVGSEGEVEIAQRDGSAAASLGARLGERLIWIPPPA